MAFPISAYGDHHPVVCFIASFPGRRANNCFELRKYEAQEVSIGNTSRSKLPVLHTFVCVCVCVCVYILPQWRLLRSAKCPRHTSGYGSTIFCCEYLLTALCQVPSSPYLKMSYFTSKDEKLQPFSYWRENDMI